MLVFEEEGKQENPEKNHGSKARTKNKLNPHMAPAGIKPSPHRQEVSVLTTAQSRVPKRAIMLSCTPSACLSEFTHVFFLDMKFKPDLTFLSASEIRQHLSLSYIHAYRGFLKK